jgi:hypothetical protein
MQIMILAGLCNLVVLHESIIKSTAAKPSLKNGRNAEIEPDKQQARIWVKNKFLPK